MRVSALALAGLIVVAGTSATYASFAGVYAPDQWTFYTDGGACGGEGAGELYPDLMKVEGVDCETSHCTECLAYYILTAPHDDTLFFDYLFTSMDPNAWDWVDRAFYMIDDTMTYITWEPDDGSTSVEVLAGQEFALGVWSEDGLTGSAELRVTNFVPEPSCLALLSAGALLALRRRR